MSGLHDSLEAVRRATGARTACLLRSTAGLLGLAPPIIAGEFIDAEAIGAALGAAIPVPARTSGELAQRLASLVGERRRGGAARPPLRLAIPAAAEAHLLLVRGEDPASTAGLALAIDVLAAQLRPPVRPHELVEAASFLQGEPGLSLLADREGDPLVLSPLLRRSLGGDREGRPVWITPARRVFFDDLRRMILADETSDEVRGLELPGTLHLRRVGDGAFVLGQVKGEVARAARLRALAGSEVTPRELTCGLRLAEGKSYRAIAAELDVSPDTVKLHLRALYQKLAVDGRDRLVARVAGLAPPPPVVRRAI